MTKEILIKFFRDNCSDRELKEVIRWIKEESSDPNQIALVKEVWDLHVSEFTQPDEKKIDSLLDRIHHKINIKLQQKLEINASKHSVLTWVTRAAAIFLVPVLVYHFFTISNKTQIISMYTDTLIDSLEIVTPIGSQTVVHLSDGSEVFLNHQSKLKYPQRFNENERIVILEGEGYFNIVANPEKPFIVKTENLNIKAIGTSFNVFAYPDEEFASTTLVEGKLVVEKVDNGRKEVLGTMLPGQHVSYNYNAGKVTSSMGNIENYISWKDGELVFKNESIINIAKRLSRWYNVEIIIDDDASKKYSYTASFVDETLEQILDLLKLATPITYKKIPRKKLQDGTYSKEKIVITSRKMT